MAVLFALTLLTLCGAILLVRAGRFLFAFLLCVALLVAVTMYFKRRPPSPPSGGVDDATAGSIAGMFGSGGD